MVLKEVDVVGAEADGAESPPKVAADVHDEHKEDLSEQESSSEWSGDSEEPESESESH